MSLFVKTDAHPLLAEQTEVFEALEKAVIAAEEAAPARLQAYSELFTPRDDAKKRKDGKTARQVADERKLAFVAACCREQAAFHPLCGAMDAMHDLLMRYFNDFSSITLTLEQPDFFIWMRDAVYCNIHESLKLYRRAIKALSKLSLRDYEWTLGVCAQQTSEAELGWLGSIPKLPEREHENPHWTHVNAHVMARMLCAIEEMRPSHGNVCVALDREQHEESAGYDVARALRDHGWEVTVQDRPALCVTVPPSSEDDDH